MKMTQSGMPAPRPIKSGLSTLYLLPKALRLVRPKSLRTDLLSARVFARRAISTGVPLNPYRTGSALACL
jgi:hypothetical protein